MNACPNCDTLYTLASIPANTAAHCSRCGHKLTTHRSNGFELAVAFSSAALVLLFISATHPFLTFSASGREVSMTLLDSALSLFEHQQEVLGGIVFSLIFLLPLALLVNQTLLLLSLERDASITWLKRLGRSLDWLKTWNMVEVFLVSVFVSAAKLASMAALELGIAFFSFVGFTLCTLAAVNLVDPVQLWRRIEAAQA